MSSGMYRRRWVNAGNDGSSTSVQRNENVTQAIIPHTYGTSWNSVRWNKPLESGGRTADSGYWNRSMLFSEPMSKDYDTKSSYSMPPLGRLGSQPASKNNIELKNSGPYIRERSVRFGDSMLSVMNDKTSSRTSPRLPWLSDNLTNRRSTTYNKLTRNPRESSFIANSRWIPTSSPATRSFQSGVRNAIPASSSSISTSHHDRPFLSNTSQTVSSNHVNATLRADRPWRRRMADAARLRNVHGDEIGGAVYSTLTTMRACRNSIPKTRDCTNNNGDELRSSLNALKSYIDEQTTSFYRQNNRFPLRDSTTFTDQSSADNSVTSIKQHTPIRSFYSNRWNSGRFSEHMSRSHSPIRPRPSAYNMKLSKYNSISTEALLPPLRFPWQSNADNLYENVKSHVSGQAARNSPIPESTYERKSSGRLLSSKDRTLRHQSRQRKLGMESNSSSDNEQQTEQQRKRKLRKRFRKKSNDEGKSEGKQLLRSAEKRMTITDNEISVKIDIQKENAVEEKEIQQSYILDSSERSSLMIFSVAYSKGSELKIVHKECDKAQPGKGKKKKDNKLINKLPSFVKNKKSTKKCDNTANAEPKDTNRKKAVKNATDERKKGNKYTECKDIPTGMQKMLNIDVQLADRRERFCLDQLSPSRLLSPTTLSLLNSSCNNTAMGTSIDNLFEASEKSYDDMAHFDSSEKSNRSKSKSPAPVPGTWSGPDYHEMNISHNKRLQRPETCSSEKVLGVIIKKCRSCTVPAMTFSATKPKPCPPVEVTLSCAFRPLTSSNEKVSFGQKYFRLIKMDKKLLAIINATIKFDASFTSQMRSVEDTFDIIKMKKRYATCLMAVKEPSVRTVTIRESIFERSDKQNSCRAQVTVLTSPVADINFYRCLKHVQIKHSKCYPLSVKSFSKQVHIAEENNTKQKIMNEINGTSNQLLSKKANADEALSKKDELMLLDHFLFEKHVKYKLEKLKRMHSEPVEFDDSKESLCPLPVSELMRACAVRILEPARQVPYITAPSRSRLGSVEVDTVSTPVRTYGEQFLSVNYHGSKNSPADRSERSMSLTKPSFEFDVPMSPFEQSLQNQAFQLRKISTFSDGDIPVAQDISTVDIAMQLPVRDHSRYPSVEGSSLTSNFTAAVAAAAQPRHERYAAHIPVTRLDRCGRQSATSIDSCNSGTLDTTTLQLDQMIDQARYRHHQHRNKFKEAIDYLDQIFEDLKIEGDQVDTMHRPRGIPVAPIRKCTSNSGTDLLNVAVSPVNLQQRNSNTKPAVVNIVGPEEMNSRKVPFATTNKHSLYTSKPKVTEKQCLQEKAASFVQTSADIETSETVVLPLQDRKLKGERMDFTKRWLTGDIKSWVAAQPKPDLILGGVEEEPDIDERSVGSCSAEVAAINSVDRKKKKARDVPDLIQNVASNAKYVRHSNPYQIDPSTRKCSGGQYLQQTDPIKPLPVKAQATLNFPTGSIGNLNNFNSFSQSFHDSNVWSSNYDINSNQIPLQRIPSHSRISKQRHHDFGAISWRSSSQGSRHNTLTSVRSDEVQLSTRKMGAFTPLQPHNLVTTRGSVASLPDSSNIRPHPYHSADPIVAIDALVAELELNTDQMAVANKRRSFPTGNEFFVRHVNNYEKPISSQQVEQNSIRSSANTKLEYSTGRKQQPQKLKDSFNEMADMLQSVISDVTTPNELSKGRKYVQMGMKSGSVLSPFETINQEKLNPSKVEAMQSIFENKQHASTWRRNISNDNGDNVQSTANTGIKDDDNYYEINDLVVPRKELIPVYAKPLGKQSSSTVRPTVQTKRRLPSAATSARSEFIPSFPVTHPPPHPPGSTNSSQTGGYYSSGSSLGAQSSYTSPNNYLSPGNRGLVHGKQSVSSRADSLDEEDDGFYDNIQMDEKRFSRGSELDSLSTCSHRALSTTVNKPAGPVKTSSRIGQFLRKISASKPPISAASLVSLNKVASEIMPTRPIPLMKSNSLSHYQGKKYFVQNMDSTASSAMVDKRGGLGQRLKNSIFGSKKRLN